jgi:hypothetical protein
MAKKLAHGLEVFGMRFKVARGCKMPELMRRHSNADMFFDG